MFLHEKLEVYQISINFVAWANELVENIKRQSNIKNQLDRASISIPLNIAEGNGKESVNEHCRFLQVAKGSALEYAACLDVLVAKKVSLPGEIEQGKQMLLSVVNMISKLIQSLKKKK